MSVQYGKLCSAILRQHFGDTVQLVGDHLFAAVSSRTLAALCKATAGQLTRAQCAHALAVLLKFQLVTVVEPTAPRWPLVAAPGAAVYAPPAEYRLLAERVLLVLRYARYVHLVSTRPRVAAAAAEVGAQLVEELLRSGGQSATRLLARCCDDRARYPAYEAAFVELVQANYVVRAPQLVQLGGGEGTAAAAETGAPLVPKFVTDQNLLFVVPKLSAVEWERVRKEEAAFAASDDDIFWLVNMDRCHQDFRDTLLTTAVERKYDANVAECMRHILHQMYRCTQPWMTYSNPISLVDIRHGVEARSQNAELSKYLDQYVNILLDDQMRILSKYGDMGGGQYVVDMKNIIDQLTWVCIENVITEKFGTKAARIFRVVRQKNYVEQEEIQRQAMIPAKEAKLYTYKLLEEHYLQAKPIRKPGGGGTGMAKCFFMFHVNQQQIVQMLLETCYKALFNTMSRSNNEKSEHRRLIEKSQRVESIVEAMKERGETDEYIAEIYETLTPPERDVLQKVKVRIKMLYSAEIGLDETIFLLQLFMRYRQLPPTTTTAK